MSGSLLMANAVVALAAFVQASAGIGFAMVAVPLLALLDLAYVPGPTLVAALVLALAMASGGRGAIAAKDLGYLLPAVGLGTVAGAMALSHVPAEGAGLLFGLAILGAVLVTAAGPAVPVNGATLTAGGAVAGLMGTVSGIHGPPLAVLYQRERPARTRATVAVVLCLGYVGSLTALRIAGHFDADQLLLGLSLVPGILAGFVAARTVADALPDRLVRVALLGVSATSAAVLIVRSLRLP